MEKLQGLNVISNRFNFLKKLFTYQLINEKHNVINIIYNYNKLEVIKFSSIWVIIFLSKNIRGIY